MAPTRSLNVVITGDSKPLGVASTQSVKHMGSVEKGAGRMGKAVKAGFAVAAVGTGALVVGLKKSVDAAVDAEKSQAKLKAQLNASGASYRAHAKEIDAVIQKHSRLAGVDDEDLQDAFTGLVRSTGKVSVAMKDMGLVTDIMRGKNVDAATSGKILEKVHNGNVTGLKKLGIAIDPVTKAQDKLKASNKDATKEQVAAAKAADKASTAQKGIAELQKRFGGQAAAYGKTAAGAQDRFAVAMENVQEKLGAKLLPVLGTVANGVSKFLSQIDRGTGAGGRFAAIVSGAFEKVKEAVQSAIPTAVAVFDRLKTAMTSVVASIVGLVRGFQEGRGAAVAIVAALAGLAAAVVTVKVITAVTKAWAVAQAALNIVMDANPIGLIIVGLVGLSAALVVAYKKSDTFRGIVDGAFKAIKTTVGSVMDWLVPKVKTAFEVVSTVVAHVVGVVKGYIGGLVTVVRGMVGIVKGVISGDFSEAWNGVKTVVRGALKSLGAVIRGVWGPLGEAMLSLGKSLIRSIVDGLSALPGALKDAIVSSVTWAAKNVPKLIGESLKGLGGAISSGIESGFKKLNPFGDGFGDGTGITGGGAGTGGGSLMGAKSIMSPFVSMAGRFGLHTSSGLRPGAITSSGNPSFHGSGNAVDEAGTPEGMMGYFRYLKAKFGSRLRELIYTPGGQGIKDGKPFTYTGQVAADHFDHVHVAFTGGAGDGVGRVAGTGDGIGAIKSLWTREGGSASQQNMAAAIAMAESGGNPNASNRNTDGSIDRGLWQINSVHGSQSTFDREGNAKAAVSISSNGRNWNPWTVFKTGAYKQFLGAAAGTKADGGLGGSSKGGSTKGINTSGYAGGGTASGGKYNPSVTYKDEDDAAASDPFAPSPSAGAQAFSAAYSGKGSLSRPLKGGGPTKGLTQEEQDARSAARDAKAALPAGPTHDDFIRANIARSRLTASSDDDILYGTELRDSLKAQMDAALADSDPRNDSDAIDAYLAAVDALKTLTDSVAANTAAIEEQRKQYETLIAADYRNQFNVSQSQYGILAQAITDVVSGQIGGRLGLGLSGLRAAPGSVART